MEDFEEKKELLLLWRERRWREIIIKRNGNGPIERTTKLKLFW